MSPSLFILAIEGLSILLKNAKGKKDIQGVNFARIVNLTHLNFVDDVLMFGKGMEEEWGAFHSLVSLFCDSLGLEVSSEKTCMIF